MPLARLPRQPTTLHDIVPAGTSYLVAAVLALVVALAPGAGSASGTRPTDHVGLGPAVGTTDGWVGPDRSGVDDDVPALSRLRPALRDAVRSAAAAARADGVELRVNSGWRSAAYQRRLLLEAVVERGGVDEALRWVATPAASTHVSGDAVDIGPPEAAAWVGAHGAEHGLCRVFTDEPWHVELLVAPGGTCPALRPVGAAG